MSKQVLPIHGDQHCPGGPDPIPCLGVQIFRAQKYSLANEVTVTGTSAPIDFDWWENANDSIYLPGKPNGNPDPVMGTDLVRYVSLMQPGRYTFTFRVRIGGGSVNGVRMALNESPEDPTWGLSDDTFEGPNSNYNLVGWHTTTISRIYPEVDIFATPAVHWPDFSLGAGVGSYWTVAVNIPSGSRTVRYAQLEIGYEPVSSFPEPVAGP